MTERFNVSGALLVKLFGRPDDERDEFSGRARRVADIGIRIAMANRAFFAALTLIASLATALVYGVGGVLAIDGALTVGTLVALARHCSVASTARSPRCRTSAIDIMTALVSFERVFEVLDLPPMIARPPRRRRRCPPGPQSVRFDHVSFAYPRAEQVSLASLEAVARTDSAPSGPVLHDISFEVAPGQMVALVGPSGAGKTTLTSLVAAPVRRHRRTVLVGGYDVRDVTLARCSGAVGVVTQDAHLFHDTIEANLRYAAPDATEEQIWQTPCSRRGSTDLVRVPAGRARARWSATVATGSPVARSSAWRSRGCC